SNEQFRMKQFIDKGIGYGMEAVQVDGNNILATRKLFTELAASIRQRPRPVLVECLTFRMRGHEEASGTKYVPQELFDKWGKKDPVNNYENFLLKQGVIDETHIALTRKEIKQEIESNLETAFAEVSPEPDTSVELGDMYSDQLENAVEPSAETIEMRFVDAISDGLREAMRRHDNLVLMGQDIADYGGVFKVTQGFTDEFGKGRVRNTPLCESAIVGAAQGLAINGMKAVVEMQFADFVTCGFNQIVNNLAKTHYRWGQNVDVVVRMPTGAGVNAGPFHSQSNEAWFFHTPGLKVVYPAFPADAKGLLISSIADPNPVMFFEHKALYRSISGQVPAGYFSFEIGKAARIRSGEKISIISYGLGVHWALEWIDRNPEISVDLIDLRSLLPWDKEIVEESACRTGRVLVLHEDTFTGGIGGEIAAHINQHCFRQLDAPVVRCGSLDTPVPMNLELENNFLAKNRLDTAIRELLAF
ncbi:MAG: transketolase C-terminal domain-containing protein, partial [Bacteroidota bacterium]